MKTVILLSGGLDSVTLLYKLKYEKHTLRAVIIDYGQPHKKEIHYAKEACRMTNTPFEMVDLRNVFDLDEFKEGKNDFIIPNRNMVFISVACSIAERIGFDRVVIGSNADDTKFPDCSYEFIHRMTQASEVANSGLMVQAPLIDKTKRDILRMADRMDIPHTWSCYIGGDEPCGKCPACIQILNANK